MSLLSLLTHPWLRLGVALGMVASGLDDLLGDLGLGDDLLGLDVHHGVLAYGAVHSVEALKKVVEGASDLREAVK